MQQQNKAQKKMNTPLLLMALTVLIDFTGFGLLFPLLPFWALRLGASPFMIGVISAAFTVAQVIGIPILGALSDKYGRKPVILVSLLIEVISLILSALANSIPLLLLARCIGGLGASNIASAQAVAADTTSEENRAASMGMIGAAIGVGFVLGPIIGGSLTVVSLAAPFWAAAGIALINAILVWRFLPETRFLHATSNTAAKQKFNGSLIKNTTILQLVSVNFIYTLAFSGMETIFALFIKWQFHWGTIQAGWIFTFIGVIVVIVQGGLIRQLTQRFKLGSILISGLLLLGIGLFVIPLGNSVGAMFVGLGLLSIGDGLVTPVISSMISAAGSKDTQGSLLGAAQSAASVGRIAGPLIATVLFSAIGVGAPFYAGAIIVAIAAADAFYFVKITPAYKISSEVASA